MRMPCVAGVALVLSLMGGVAVGQQNLTCELGPYDLVKANWMGANYLQALLSPRWEAVAFAHDRFGDAEGVGGMYFIDDQGRVIWAWAAEAEFGPVARVEATAMAVRGILRARIPGSAGRYFFMLDGRQSLYLRPTEDGIGAFWLQDTSTPYGRLAVRVKAGGKWQEASMEPRERMPEVFERASGYEAQTPVAGLQIRNCSAALDRAPELEVSLEAPGEVQVRFRSHDAAHYVWPNRGERMRAEGGLKLRPGRPWVLLERDDHLGTSDKQGWEDPKLWSQQTSLTLVAFDPAPAALALEETEGRTELVAQWRGVRQVRVRTAPFLEVDPTDREYVFAAADRVAREGRFGLGPYYPVRSSNGFMGAVLGLAAGAWMLERYGHPEAGQAKAAALEAFGAVVDAESRGYFGERVYNATLAAYYLKRIAPEAFDYEHWVRIWADRELGRIPPGWQTPPWSDTALRALCHWRYAYAVTGDERYRQAREEGLAQFGLPAEAPYDGFTWREKLHPFDGYDCTGAAHLLGEWGASGDPQAHRMAQNAGPRYFCDLGFAPYRTWTCDDLLPYYVGHSLPAVYGQERFVEQVVLGLDQYAKYDAGGTVTLVGRPVAQVAP